MNVLKEIVAKVATNVTGSIASAVVVTLLTTYVLVDLGKKGAQEDAARADSVKAAAGGASSAGQGTGEAAGGAQDGISGSVSGAKGARPAGPASGPGEERQPASKGGAAPDASATSAGGAGEEGGAERGRVARLAKKNPVERKLEEMVGDARAGGDSLGARPEKKKSAEAVQKVRTRADDVFDELDDEEARKKPD